MENAESSYGIVCEKELFYGKNVILIDDIVTTGASMGVCASLLKSAGAKTVTALVYAKTDGSSFKRKNQQ